MKPGPRKSPAQDEAWPKRASKQSQAREGRTSASVKLLQGCDYPISILVGQMLISQLHTILPNNTT